MARTVSTGFALGAASRTGVLALLAGVLVADVLVPVVLPAVAARGTVGFAGARRFAGGLGTEAASGAESTGQPYQDPIGSLCSVLRNGNGTLRIQ
jgi:hypothetical protein